MGMITILSSLIKELEALLRHTSGSKRILCVWVCVFKREIESEKAAFTVCCLLYFFDMFNLVDVIIIFVTPAP